MPIFSFRARSFLESSIRFNVKRKHVIALLMLYTAAHSLSKIMSRALLLDILRVLLCVAVIEGHYTRLVNSGAIAVMGFFVISGYFLAKSFERMPQGFEMVSFYKKKASNLLPEYLVSMLPAGIIALLCFELPRKLDYSPFCLIRMMETFNPASWYLSCLFLFFGLAPFLYWINRSKTGIYVAFALSLLYTVTLYVAYDGTRHVLWGKWMYGAWQTNITYFLGGIVAYRMRCALKVSQSCAILIASFSFLVLLGLVVFHSWVMTVPGGISNILPYTLGSCILFMLLVPCLDFSTKVTTWYHRIVVWMGGLTYALYLFHIPVRTLTHYVIEETGLHVPHTYVLCFMLLVSFLSAVLFSYAKKLVIKHMSASKHLAAQQQ